MERTRRARVFIRIRPPGAQEEIDPNKALKILPGSSTIRVIAGSSQTDNGKEQAQDPATSEVHDYSFDGVFPMAATQEDVFKEIGLPLLNDCMNGINSTMFAYGQTGSGKTHSVLKHGSGNDAGLLQRLITGLYGRIGEDTANTYKAEVSALQVYNEQVDDLLHLEADTAHSRRILTGGTIQGLTCRPCSDHTVMLAAIADARRNMTVAETKMNKRSSRSHAIFVVRVTRYSVPVNNESRLPKIAAGTTASLTIVDLAGSERVKKSGVDGPQLTEATYVNRSLHALGNVVSALAANKRHIPYRNSKLTRLLEGCIGGECKTVLLVCLAPECSSETASSLQFALRAMKVQVQSRSRINTPDSLSSASLGSRPVCPPFLQGILKGLRRARQGNQDPAGQYDADDDFTEIDLEEGVSMLEELLLNTSEAPDAEDLHADPAQLQLRVLEALGKGSAHKALQARPPSLLTQHIRAMEASEAEHHTEQNLVQMHLEIDSWRDAAQKALRDAQAQEAQTELAQERCSELQGRLRQLQITQGRCDAPTDTEFDELHEEVLALREELEEKETELLEFQDDCETEIDTAASMLADEKSQSAAALRACEKEADAQQRRMCARLEAASARHFHKWHAEFEGHPLDAACGDHQEEAKERERISGLQAKFHRELESAKEEGLNEARAAQRTLQQVQGNHTIAAGVLEMRTAHFTELNSEQNMQLEAARQDVLAAKEATDRVRQDYRQELAEARKETTEAADLARSTKQDLQDLRYLEENVKKNAAFLETRAAKHVEECDQLRLECGMLHKEVHSYNENRVKRFGSGSEYDIPEALPLMLTDGRQASAGLAETTALVPYSSPTMSRQTTLDSENLRLRDELEEMIRQQTDFEVELDRVRQESDEQVMEARHCAAEAVSGEAQAANSLQKYCDTAVRKVQQMKTEVSECATARSLQKRTLKKITQDKKRVTTKASMREQQLLEELSDAYLFNEEEYMAYVELQSRYTELEESMQQEAKSQDDMEALSYHSEEELDYAEEEVLPMQVQRSCDSSFDMDHIPLQTSGLAFADRVVRLHIEASDAQSNHDSDFADVGPARLPQVNTTEYLMSPREGNSPTQDTLHSLDSFTSHTKEIGMDHQLALSNPEATPEHAVQVLPPALPPAPQAQEDLHCLSEDEFEFKISRYHQRQKEDARMIMEQQMRIAKLQEKVARLQEEQEIGSYRADPDATSHNQVLHVSSVGRRHRSERHRARKRDAAVLVPSGGPDPETRSCVGCLCRMAIVLILGLLCLRAAVAALRDQAKADPPWLSHTFLRR